MGKGVFFVALIVQILNILGSGYSFRLESKQALVNPLMRCTDPGVVVITFDDGPYIYTPDVLDVLKEKNVTTTFFINGATFLNLDETAQAILRRAISEGHTIGSHTWDHQNLNDLTPEQIRTEMTQLSDALTQLNILPAPPTFMRPPFGSYNDQVVDIITGNLGYVMVNWSIDTADWSHPGDTEAGVQGYRDVLQGTDPATTLGFIALHHDVQVGGAELAAAAIDYARSQGYRFVRLEECLGMVVIE